MDGEAVHSILSVVHEHSGVDFNFYKQPTVLRRIDRRMAITQLSMYADYLELLRGNSSERELLFQDLLIKVTSFFRDPEMFRELGKTVVPKILDRKTEDDPIRVWVAGCATGEEVYSIAICFLDAMDTAMSDVGHTRNGIQFFASDLSEQSIQKARTGIYSITEVQSLSQKQLKKYFVGEDGSYRVIQSLRDSVVFAVHNFLNDPPFAKVDLISCRNVFIYLDAILQKKALATFHYSLKENGFLIMGKSETTVKITDLFLPFSKKERIYLRKQGPGRYMQTTSDKRRREVTAIRKKKPSGKVAPWDYKKSAETVLISKYTPASVVVDEFMEIVHINGNMVPFLNHPSGKPSHELMKMARKELAFELRNALHKAKVSQDVVIKKGIPMDIDGERLTVSIEVVPLTNIIDPHYLIIFVKKSLLPPFWDRLLNRMGRKWTSTDKDFAQQRIWALEKELEQSREDMRSISEEQESYNEELQSANEELLSSNEEMQSLNEELETSREELQSTNEEISVVNRELLEKQQELRDSLTFVDAIIATVLEPFVILDGHFVVQKSNASYFRAFKVTEKEIMGKPFFAIQDQQWNAPALRSMLQRMLPEKERIEAEEITLTWPSGEERSFVFSAREIVQQKETHKLVLLTMQEITERKRKEQDYHATIAELNQTNQQLDQFVYVASHDLQEPLRKIMIFSNRLLEKGDRQSFGDMELYLKKIESSSERMSSLIKNMLNYSRLVHLEKLFEPTDMNQIMVSILADFELLMEQKRATVNIGQLPVLNAIPMQINQLLYNLVSNALKFTKKDVAAVVDISARTVGQETVEKYPSLDPGIPYCEIIVKDNGIGFSPKFKDRIFTIFQRLHQNGQYTGTGIGLSLAKKITENHHGEIFALSEEGKGSEFHVLLPNGTYKR
jgi:two-component system CheB/CheR fusion protein